jgi:hypothetical protein
MNIFAWIVALWHHQLRVLYSFSLQISSNKKVRLILLLNTVVLGFCYDQNSQCYGDYRAPSPVSVWMDQCCGKGDGDVGVNVMCLCV